jgi:hypothetical protein
MLRQIPPPALVTGQNCRKKMVPSAKDAIDNRARLPPEKSAETASTAAFWIVLMSQFLVDNGGEREMLRDGTTEGA